MRQIGGPETIRHVVVDGNNVLQRAFYVFVEARMKQGLPLLSGPNGYPTGVIYGFLSFLGSWLHDLAPVTRISIFFDGSPTRRRKLDPSYKIKRDENKHDLRLENAVKIPIKLRDGFEADSDLIALSHILQVLGCDIYHHPDEEADDLIASFCKQNPDSVRMIVSDDKDFFQLLTDPRVICFRPGSKDRRFVDAAASEEVWGRLLQKKHPKVPPGQVRMFKSLCGDSSDGISGIFQLRKKVALTVCHLPTVEDVYTTGFPNFSVSEREKTLAARERIQLNWQLVGLKDDLDLSIMRQSCPKDADMAINICKQDLLMTDLDFSAFRPTKPAQMQQLPIEDWLAGI